MLASTAFVAFLLGAAAEPEGRPAWLEPYRTGVRLVEQGQGAEARKALETALAGKLGVTGKALLVPEEAEPNLELAARNNPRLKAVPALGVSVVDLLEHDTVVFSEPALVRLTEVLTR